MSIVDIVVAAAGVVLICIFYWAVFLKGGMMDNRDLGYTTCNDCAGTGQRANGESCSGCEGTGFVRVISSAPQDPSTERPD